jgi:hypothetical protein
LLIENKLLNLKDALLGYTELFNCIETPFKKTIKYNIFLNTRGAILVQWLRQPEKVMLKKMKRQ